MQIKVLHDKVANQIAAGEVVERPASVVRELVDNAIDAGALHVQVYITEGGQSLIKVVDNGRGMNRDDALLAFERHATSKLSTIDDLQSLTTLGFRGEALPSIASVAKIFLRTRTAESSVATQVEIEGGKLLGVKSIAGPLGTEVHVAQLFFNTPARKKFLKSPRAEELRVKQWLSYVAMANPQIRLSLTIDEKEVLSLSKVSTLEERASQLMRGSKISFEKILGEIRVAGVLAHPSLAEFQSQALVILVNKRVVSDRLIAKAVKEGFGGTLKEREFPLGVISVSMHPSEVDVNVHPQKNEVRFKTPQNVFLAVRTVVQEAVREFKGPVSAYGTNLSAPTASYDSVLEVSSEPSSFLRGRSSQASFCWSPEGNTPLDKKEEAGPFTGQAFSFSGLRFLGQLFECYLLCEKGEEFYIVDMHAAHERVSYNRIRKGFEERNAASQKLLIPVEVRLSEEGTANIMNQEELLSRVGFEIELLGNSAVEIKAVPSFLKGEAVEVAIKELASVCLGEDGKRAIEAPLDSIAARLACHGSIRSGKIMNREEVYALFDSLDEVDFSAACPHGRPVVLSFPKNQLEKWFGRKQ